MFRFRAEDLVTLGYIISLGLMVILFSADVKAWPNYLLLHLAATLIVLGLIYMASKRKQPWILARNWYHIAFIPLAFKELNYLIPSIRSADIDPILADIDRFLFGVDPTVWLERWTFPLLTEYLQVVYSTFYFLPITLGAILWAKGKYLAFQKTLLSVITAFYISYIGYLLFPALGPRYEIDHLQSFQLEGIFLTPWLREILDLLEGIQRDAFPSGHTGIALLVLYHAWREEKNSTPYFLVIVISLIFSTVYLRYHYVVDVFAGFVLAGGSWWFARLLDTWWKEKKGDPFIPA